MGFCKSINNLFQIAKEEVVGSPPGICRKEEKHPIYYGYFQLFARNIIPVLSISDAIKACRGKLEEYNTIKELYALKSPAAAKPIERYSEVLFGKVFAGLVHLTVAGVGIAMATGLSMSMGLPIIFGAIGLGLLVSCAILLKNQKSHLVSKLANLFTFIVAIGVPLACAMTAALKGITFIKAFVFLAATVLTITNPLLALLICICAIMLLLLISAAIKKATDSSKTRIESSLDDSRSRSFNGSSQFESVSTRTVHIPQPKSFISQGNSRNSGSNT